MESALPADRVRIRMLAGLTSASMLLMGLSMVLSVDSDSEIEGKKAAAAASLEAIAAERTLFYLGTIVGAVGVFLVALSSLAFLLLARRRGAVLATIGSTLMFVGAIAFGAMLTMYGTVETILTGPDVPRDAAISVESVAGDSSQVAAMWAGGFIALMIGVLLNGLALLRAGTTPVWVPWLMFLGIVTVFFGDDGWTGVLATVPWAMAWIGVGWALVREDEEPAAVTLPSNTDEAYAG